MPVDQTIPFISKEGHEYFIIFDKIEEKAIPDGVIKTIVDVTIAIADNKGINNCHTLKQITSIIKSYLDENDVILYCFCDNKEIFRSIKHSHLTPQEYRSLLFTKLFDNLANEEYINKPIVITDDEQINHHIHLISKEINQDDVNILSGVIFGMGK
jgi:hypothetical protein